MRVVTAEAIDGALTWPALIEALAEAFRGGVAAPGRHHHTIGRDPADATLLLMPAWSSGAGGFVGVKVVSVFPDNARRAEPSVQGTYLLADGDTGRPLAALDGTRLTLWRTAAASALVRRGRFVRDRRSGPVPGTRPATRPMPASIASPTCSSS